MRSQGVSRSKAAPSEGRLEQAGQQVVGEEVDLEGDLVAVGGDGVPLGGGHARVVDEDVEVRVVADDAVRHGLDLVEVGEAGGEGAQLRRVDPDGGDEAVGCGLGLLGGAAVQQDGGAAFGELPGGLVTDAGGGAGDEDGAGRKGGVGHGPIRGCGHVERPRRRGGGRAVMRSGRAPCGITAPLGSRKARQKDAGVSGQRGARLSCRAGLGGRSKRSQAQFTSPMEAVPQAPGKPDSRSLTPL